MADPIRFASLLQPIRDLSKVWKIDIADELQKYVEEIAQITKEDLPENGIPRFNFAEGALLIQGSTAIYSRKVEMLYDLVCQALDLLHSEKSGAAAGKKGRPGTSGLWGPIPEMEELMTIDHLLKEGRGLQLDPNVPEQRFATQRRVPLFLMPRNKEDRRTSEFRISNCTVHHSGAYLLQESDSQILDDLVARDESLRQNRLDSPLVPPPPKEVQEYDQQLQELHELHLVAQGQLVATPAPTVATPGQVGTPAKGATPHAMTPAAGKTPVSALAGLLAQSSLAPAGDFWSLQDEHTAVGAEQPLKVGKSTRRTQGAKRLLADAETLPELFSHEPISDQSLWTDEAAVGVAAMATAGDPVEQLFLAVGGQLKQGSARCETQRARFSSAWLEFEDLFLSALSRWRQLRMSSGGTAPPGAADDFEEETPKKMRQDDVESDADNPPALATPMKTPGRAHLGGAGGEDNVEDSHRQGVEKLEGMILEAQQAIQDAQLKYEETIRQHLKQLANDSIDSESQKFPQLYANVRKWQEQLEPVLKEFESRPEFHIMSYSTNMLDAMVANEEAVKNGVPFKALVDGLPRYEVCRRFLTALFLTNQGNTDIIFETEEQRINDFKVKVLNADKEWIALEDDGGRKGSKRQKADAKDSKDATSGEKPKKMLRKSTSDAPGRRGKSSPAGA